MTVAALQAKAMHRCLRGGDRTLAHRFFRAAAKPIASAWQLATSSDLALPEVEATRSLAVRIANAYTERLLTAAETDAVVAERFARVTGLVDPPAMLLHPKMIRAAAMRRRSPQRSNGR